jgi:acyl dehydratase
MLFDALEIGTRLPIGRHSFTEAEIRRFAEAYDPQPFHVDPAAAEKSHFGGLIASGWHVAAVWMKLNVAFLKAEAEARRARGEAVARLGPSPGFRNMVWARPVRPGDVLDYVVTISGKKASALRPDWGIVSLRNEAFDGEGRLVFAFDGAVFWGRTAA